MGAGGVIRPIVKGAGAALLALLLILLVAGGMLAALGWRLKKEFNPDPVTIAAASLQAVREQAVLTPFAARFVAVVTSEQHRFGFSAKRTLIMPGLVRYELDLAALHQRDLAWDAATHTLTITLPPMRLSQPQVDLAQIRTYGEGGVLMTLTDVGNQLDSVNKAAGQAELVRQAQDALPMRLAHDAARNAIARSFVMPLKAAGVDATVTAKFAGEA
jgi:ABC-type amino acid transport substrate-binding protein